MWRPGEFADEPVHTGGPIPHWSRWEKSPTTLGPVSRVALTIIIVSWLLSVAVGNPLTLVFVAPLMAVILRGVWMKGWVVPSDQAAETTSSDHVPEGPLSSWLWEREELVSTVAGALLALVLVGVVMTVDNPIAKFVAIVAGVVTAGFLAFRKIEGRR